MSWWNPASWRRSSSSSAVRVEPRMVPTAPPLVKRAFNGAVIDALTADLPAILQSGNASLRPALRVLRSRSRQLAENNDYAREFLRHLVRKALGPDGIRLVVRALRQDGTVDKADSDYLETAWWEWSRRGVCTVCGRYSWAEVQRLALQAVARDGELLIRVVRGWKGNRFGIALQLIEIDQLDENLNVAFGAGHGGVQIGAGNEIRMGVERDAWGKVVAYHLLSSHPYDDVSSWQGQYRYQRIPAGDMIHLFVPDRVDDARGAPWMSTAIRRLQMMGGYEEAELVAARLGAAKGGFFEEEIGDELDGTGDAKDVNGNIIQDATPGTFQRLPKGVTFKPYDPQHPTAGFGDFMKSMLRGAAAGLGIGYNSWGRDLEGVNYSSLRQGELDERDNWRLIQGFMIERLCDPVWQAWLDMALLTGALNLPPSKRAKFDAANWRARGWPWVDPTKDIAAEAEAVALGIRSLSQVCDERGIDFEEVMRDRARENEIAAQYGVEIFVGPPKQVPGTAPEQPAGDPNSNAN